MMSRLLSIIVSNDGRQLKRHIQGLIKSGACDRVIVSNYVHSYHASKGKSLNKTQHKLLQIHYDDETKLTTMLDKLIPDWRSDHWVSEISTL